MKRKTREIKAMLLVLSLIIAIVAVPISASAGGAEDGFYHGSTTSKLLWSPTSDNSQYTLHRIPGIVVTKRDTVIVYCEARTGDTTHSVVDSGDWCRMDVYIQRSTDGGETFGDPIYIAKGDENTATINNPVMIVGNDNTLHILYCKNYSIYGGGLWYRKSTDDGLTWTPEREITQFAESVPHQAFAFGPTHGICTVDGRLMTAVWLVPADKAATPTAHGPSQVYTFYSDDNGETWALSDAASSNSNETAIAQLSDGTILLNSRANPYRKITTSTNGISGWTATRTDTGLPDPGCCGGMVTVDIEGLPRALLFVNCNTSEQGIRTNVTVKCSFDDGKTWSTSVLLSDNRGGYADIAVDSKGCVYVLYEFEYGKNVRLARISLLDSLCNTDELPQLLSTETKFAFDSQDKMSWVIESKNLTNEWSNGALRLTASDTKNFFATFDFSAVTRNLNLSDYRVMAMRVRGSSEGREETQLGMYIRSGSTYTSVNNRYLKASVPNDGEWHTVYFDFTDKAALGGILRSLQLEMHPDTGKGSTGDFLEISSISFYKSMNEAELDSNCETNAGTQNEAPEKSGCASSISSGAVILLSMSVVLIGGKRKKDKITERGNDL